MKSVKNPETRAYPNPGKNTTRSEVTSNRGRTVTAEQGRSNVNVAQGPRTGNVGDSSKRAAFKSGKSEANVLAKTINDAYGARKIRDSIDPRLEGISPDTKPRSRGR